jgi:hypothetical protein
MLDVGRKAQAAGKGCCNVKKGDVSLTLRHIASSLGMVVLRTEFMRSLHIVLKGEA